MLSQLLRMFGRRKYCSTSRRRRSRIRVEELETRALLAMAYGDFNGDSHIDLAIGSPQADVVGFSNAGAVHIMYGTADGLNESGSQEWSADSPGLRHGVGPGDQFGFSLATDDFNGDGFEDLAIGVPYMDVGLFIDAGGVQILYGAASGLTWIGNQLWHKDVPEILGMAESFENYGWSLAAGNFGRDGYGDLAIGIPNQQVGWARDAGAVQIIRGSVKGLAADNDQLLTEVGNGSNLSQPEPYDHFGYSLAVADFDLDGLDDVVVGTPDEDIEIRDDSGTTIDTLPDQGAFHVLSSIEGRVLSPRESSIWMSTSAGLQDIVQLSGRSYLGTSFAVGDFNADGYPDLAVGAPSNDWPGSPAPAGFATSAGSVLVVYDVASGPASSSVRGDFYWKSSLLAIDGGPRITSRSYEYFGSSLAAGDFNGDGATDLAIGSPRTELRPLTSPSEEGEVHVLIGLPASRLGRGGLLPLVQTLNYYNWGLATNIIHNWTWFGLDLAASPDAAASLMIAVPGALANAGELVEVLPATNGLLSPSGTRRWTAASLAGSPGEVRSDLFGASPSTAVPMDPIFFNTFSPYPKLSNKPGTTKKLHLDFDGSFVTSTDWGSDWNFLGDDVTTPAFAASLGSPSMRTKVSLMRDIWLGVTEKYAPFDVDVTTIDPGNRDNGKTMSIAIGGNGGWYNDDDNIATGVAQLDGFLNSDSNTGFAFTDLVGVFNIWKVVSLIAHEAGHGFGLEHKGDFSADSPFAIREYSKGGNGWIPIMGSYSDGSQRSIWTPTKIEHDEYNPDNLNPAPTTFVGGNREELVPTDPYNLRFEKKQVWYSQDDVDVLNSVLGPAPDDYHSILGYDLGELYRRDLESHVVVQGVIENWYDQDAFRFRVAQRGTVTLKLTTNALAPSLDSVLTFIGGNQLTSVDDDTIGVWGSTLTTGVLDPSDGEFSIWVNSNSRFTGDIGQYTLRIEFAPEAQGWVELTPSDVEINKYDAIVHGTELDDRFTVEADNFRLDVRNDSNHLRLPLMLHVNGQLVSIARIPAGAVRQMTATLLERSDSLTIGSSFPRRPLEVVGGTGFDTLRFHLGDDGSDLSGDVQFIGESLTIDGSVTTTLLESGDSFLRFRADNATFSLVDTTQIIDRTSAESHEWRAVGSAVDGLFKGQVGSTLPYFERKGAGRHVYSFIPASEATRFVASSESDTIQVHGGLSLGGRLVTIDGGWGADVLDVSPEYAGAVTIVGGPREDAANDELRVIANNYSGRRRALIADTRMEFSFPQEGAETVVGTWLTYREFDSIEVSGKAAADEFDIFSVPAASRLVVKGQAGPDTFRVRTGLLNGALVVEGGDSSETQGDSLVLTGRGSEFAYYEPDQSSFHSGWMEVDGDRFQFRELEQVVAEDLRRVTMVTPLSMDDMRISPDESGLRISGTSHNPIRLLDLQGNPSPPFPPIPWAPLIVSQTREVILDLSTNDAIEQTLGIWRYGAVPVDIVTIDAGLLQATGLQMVALSAGAGTNVIYDHTLETVDPSTAQLLVNGGFFTPAGNTVHLLYGTPSRLEIDHPSPLQTRTTAFDAQGAQLASIIDLDVRGGLLFVDPQSEAHIDLREFDARFVQGLQGRQRIVGPEINPLEIAAAADGRLHTFGSGLLDFQWVQSPQFEFGPLVGTGIIPNGLLRSCTVTNTGDSGPGSLREALECAYAAEGDALAVVTFAIPTSDPNFVEVDAHLAGGDVEPDAFVISPMTALPTNFRGRVVINGQSQQNLTGDSNPFGPEIVLAGQQAGAGVDGLTLGSLENRIHSLNIQGFGGDGIAISGHGNVVTGSYIGTDPTGTASATVMPGIVSWWPGKQSINAANGLSGVKIVSGRDNVIGGTTEADRNVISGNTLHGVHIVGNSFPAEPPIFTDNPDQLIRRGNTVMGNFIGTTADGMGRFGNTQSGVYIDESSLNTIGGAEWGARNVISANVTGVGIVGLHSGENRVAGNFVGPAADGSSDLGNTHGVVVLGNLGLTLGASGNLIGGTTAAERNVISGNDLNDVFLARTLGTTVRGNYIGPDVGGNFMVATDPRGAVGVRLEDDKDSLLLGNLISGQAYGIYFGGRWVAGGTERTRVEGNLIGTTAAGRQALRGFSNYWGISIDGYVDSDGVTHEIHDVMIGGTAPGSGNVISGSANHGIWINGPGVDGVVIQRNRIGTDLNGVNAVPNGPASPTNGAGILLTNTTGVLIGGTEGEAGNIISGNNGSGISILGGSGHVMEGNFIGTDVSGTRDLGNSGDGIRIDNSSGNTIGGAVTAARNIISGNDSDGVELRGTGASGNLVLGNFIGTDVTGTLDLGNTANGIFFEYAPANTIGGTTASARNVISGNDYCGVTILGDFSTGNVLMGNYIGTDVTGTRDLGNSSNGIFINSAPNNTIGGTTAGSGNVISGNDSDGIGIFLSGASRNLVQGNFIGMDATGAFNLGNNRNGVTILEGASGNIIGDGRPGAGNVISGNGFSGVQIQDATTAGNSVLGNTIGTDVSGQFDRGNRVMGVWIVGAPGNRIGGLEPGQGNLISGNDINGVVIANGSATNNRVLANRVGTNAAGTGAIGNTLGVHIAGAPGNFVEGNVLSGNLVGLDISGAAARGNQIRNNLIGITANGIAVPNRADGVFIDDAPGNMLIGNTIGANGFNGVLIDGAGSFGNVLQANSIGIAIDGTTAFGNVGHGVLVQLGAGRNLIGTNGDGIADDTEGNVIAYNGRDGIAVVGNSTQGITIRRNSIFANGDQGIDLKDDGPTANDKGNLTATPVVRPDADLGPNALQNYPDISSARKTDSGRNAGVNVNTVLHSTPNTRFQIDLYKNALAGPSGRTWIATADVTTNADGTGRYSFSLPVTSVDAGQYLTATATEINSGNTSEFSGATEVRANGNSPSGQASATASSSSASTVANPSAIQQQSIQSRPLIPRQAAGGDEPDSDHDDFASLDQLFQTYDDHAADSQLTELLDEGLDALGIRAHLQKRRTWWK